MKIFSTSLIILMIVFQAVGFAATEIFSASGEYLMSDYDTPEIAEKIALDFAKQSASEKAGVYLESYSHLANFKIETDEIKTVASSKIEVFEKNIQRLPQKDGRILLHADIKAKVDTSELDNFIQQAHEQRQSIIRRYKNLQEMNSKIKNDVDEFQKKLTTIKDEIENYDLLIEQDKINREFLAKQKSEEFAKQLGESKNFSADITLLEEAIKLQPKSSWLYIEYAVFKNRTGTKNTVGEILADPANGHKVVASHAPDIREIKKANILSENGDAYGMIAVHYSTKGSAAELAGKNDEAQKYFSKSLENHNKVVELNPKSAWSYITRGSFYQTYLKDYNKALKDYETAAKLAPNNGYVYQHLGELYQEQKKYSDSVKNYQKALQIDPENFDGFDLIKLGDMYKELKKYPEAISTYTQAIEKSPKFEFSNHTVHAYLARAELYKEIGEYDKAIEDCDKGLEIAKTLDVTFTDTTLERIKKDSIKKKNFDNKYKNIDKNNAEALVERANEYYKNGVTNAKNFELAVADYMRAISIEPKIATTDEKKISTYIFFMEDKKAAVNYLNKLIKINPDSDIYYNMRGVIYEELGDNKKAISDYNKAIELDSSEEKYRKNLLRVQFPEKFQEIENLQTTAKRLEKNKKYSDAVENYNKILEIDSTNQYAYFERGRMYMKLNEYELALEDYNKLIELNPNYDSAMYYNRGSVYRNLKDYANAINDYTKYLELNPNDVDSYKNRGKCYQALGETEKANADFAKAKELDK